MSYEKLEHLQQRISKIEHCMLMLQWDEAVMMPASAGPERAEALATLSVIEHEHRTDPRVGEWLDDADTARAGLSGWQQANLDQIRRSWVRANAIDKQLVEGIVRAQTECEQQWRVLRPSGDWQGLAKSLGPLVSMKRELAARLGEVLGCEPYDALLDEYEPGLSSRDVDPVFDDLREFLPGFIKEVEERQRANPPLEISGTFAIEQQKALARTLMRAVGFDDSRGRLDESHHPFCGGVPSDVRITTRFDETTFTPALMGLLHEAGHAKYEQGLPQEWLSQPVGRAMGMAIHESQSLLQEMQICRSRAFLEYAAPLFREAFPSVAKSQPAAFTPDNLFRLYTRVERGFIRVDADEVTYPSHVILRYDIERDLIGGRVEVKDIPELWDHGMQHWLGLSTRDNLKDGPMQDVHWPAGLFGYFPFYTLGAMVAAQLHAAAQSAIPDLEGSIAKGDFTALNDYLRTAVWKKGRSKTFKGLLTEATGEPLNPRFFKQHLEQRYTPSR